MAERDVPLLAPTKGQFRAQVLQLLKSGRSRTADAAIEKDALATARLLMQEGERAAALIAHLLDILLALRQPAGQPNTTPAWSSKAYDARDRDDLIGEILIDKDWDPLARNMPQKVETEFIRRHPDIPIDDRTVAYALKTFGFIRLYWVREEILMKTYPPKVNRFAQLLARSCAKEYAQALRPVVQ
jgi:hypothetical protein